jgi:hypothetical protein
MGLKWADLCKSMMNNSLSSSFSAVTCLPRYHVRIPATRIHAASIEFFFFTCNLPKYMILVRSSSSEALSCGMTSTVLLPADLQYHQFAHTYRSSPSHLLPSSALRQTPFPPERCDITSSRVTNNQRLSLATRFSTQKWYSLSAIEVIEYPGTGGNSTPANSFK